MTYLLRRHPFAVRAFFRHSLVLTYAFPASLLEPLLPPGLVLDTFGDYGFVAIAMVQTERLRPAVFPSWFGQNLFLTGYRIFTRLASPTSSLRGLYILRSDTNRRLLVWGGNFFTHYRYRLCHASCRVGSGENGRQLAWSIETPRGEADLAVTAFLDSAPAPVPTGSPFPDLHAARPFAGPLPYTFSYEPETGSVISIRGLREAWEPQPVSVSVTTPPAFFNREPFRQATPSLANAFYVHDIPYQWNRGSVASHS